MFTLFIHRVENLPISMAANGRDPFERGEYVHLTVAIGPVKWSLLVTLNQVTERIQASGDPFVLIPFYGALQST